MSDTIYRPGFSQNGEGNIVLLLHGALADQRMWEEHAQLLVFWELVREHLRSTAELVSACEGDQQGDIGTLFGS